MYTASVNNPREDSIFSGKVKAAIKACDGSLVPALDDFEARHEAAVEAGAKGISYKEFLSYLHDHGVTGLREDESRYLCASFDDGVAPRKDNVISAATFTRHLTGLNHRRMKAVLRAWEVVLGATGGGDEQQGTVPAEQLLSTHRAAATTAAGAASQWDSTGNKVNLEGTFTTGSGNSTTVRGPALFTASKGRRSGDDGGGDVTRSEFIAFYAGVSSEYASGEMFEVMMLKEWAADQPQRPKLQDTCRAWGEEGDPLAINSTHCVHDALHMGLGVSSKSYDYTHMAREQPYREPLAPLDRVDLMESVTQRTYKPYDANAQTLADPLATRRGQMM